METDSLLDGDDTTRANRVYVLYLLGIEIGFELAYLGFKLGSRVLSQGEFLSEGILRFDLLSYLGFQIFDLGIRVSLQALVFQLELPSGCALGIVPSLQLFRFFSIHSVVFYLLTNKGNWIYQEQAEGVEWIGKDEGNR